MARVPTEGPTASLEAVETLLESYAQRHADLLVSQLDRAVQQRLDEFERGQAPQQEPGDPLLTAHEVARRLAVSVRTVWKLAASRQLVAIRLNGRITRFTANSVEDYVRRCAPGAGR